jgi:hypothetical protein
MNWLALWTATACVDFAVIVLSKFVPLTKSLATWYADFGVVAAFQDIAIIVLGIALAQLVWPGIHGWNLVAVAVLIQLVHDILFYLLVILPVPEGQNRIIDLFKKYAAEGSWKILAADSAMIASSVVLMEWLANHVSNDRIAGLGVLVAYALSYIVYTK